MLPIGIVAASFLIDLETQDDIADGFFYTFAVVSCVWVPGVTAALYTALGAMVPLVLGSLVSPPTPRGWVGPLNRVLGGILMWLVALAVWRNSRLNRDRERTLSQMEQLRRTAERAADAERIELSRWLHEGLAQEMAALGWALDRLARHAADETKVRAEATDLRSVVDAALRIVHRKAVALRESQQTAGGLPALVESSAADFARRTGLAIEVRDAGCLESVPPSFSILCIKVVQEALTNVAKHADATQVRIECRNEAGAVRIVIADNGRGMDAADRLRPDSLGLLGLHERLSAIGGELKVANGESGGVLLDARIPIRPESP
jgi:signal transduction histidine kinase